MKKETITTPDLTLMTLTDLQEVLGVGKKLATRIGTESGAQIRIGQRTYYLREKIISYLTEKMQTQSKKYKQEA